MKLFFDKLPPMNGLIIGHAHLIDPAGQAADINLCFVFGNLATDELLTIQVLK